jgi:hypothetical protein
LIQRPSASIAIIFALGLAILANTRPFEGLVFGIVAVGYLVLQWLDCRAPIGTVLRRAVLPMALLLIPVAAWMGYYNVQVTGHALALPYVVHDHQYALVEPVLWETRVRPSPAYSNIFLRDFWQADRDAKLRAHHQILEGHALDLVVLVGFLVGLPLAVCMLLVARPLWRDPIAKRALVLALLGYVGPALDTRMLPHYAAAEAVFAYILAACALRALRNAWPGVEGRYLMWGALVVFALPTGLGLLAPANRCLIGIPEYLEAHHAVIETQLQKQPGEHLVLVHYGPAAMAAVKNHQIYEELVYNHADIDGSKVIWARSLGADKDAELIRHYPNREVWVVDEDSGVTLSHQSFGSRMSNVRLGVSMTPTW